MAVVLGMDVKARQGTNPPSEEEEGDRTRRCPEYQRGPRRMEGTTLGDCERTRSIRVLAQGHSMGGSSLIVGLTRLTISDAVFDLVISLTFLTS